VTSVGQKGTGENMRKINYKIKYKKKIIGTFVAVFCLLAAACGLREDADGIAVQQGGSTSVNTEQEEDTPVKETQKIHIYTMDPDSLEAEEVSVTVDTPEGLTPQIVVDAVEELLEAQGEDIEINSVEQSENTVTVDFKGEKAPSSLVGSAEETAILDCISMSLLDNIDSCQQVVYHVDGGAYESGHYAFELNEAYKWKN
jgi:hypothetical protein